MSLLAEGRFASKTELCIIIEMNWIVLPEKKELKEGEIFNIVETKIIVFSNEVI